ncbi:AarF/ABC1/UbiB kinase family protein [Candidatus Woesearchaeota archaeon]|nr:AarF/ABC1/UbiB kinase family protein [Candidatus Woesearchaeota archaeon]
MLNLKREVKDIKRFNQIILILTQQGFGYLLGKISLKKIFKKKRLDSSTDSERALRLRKTLEKLGPTFIKLGQILSLRPDLLPKEYVKELGKLQDKVPPFSYEEVEETIRQELKKPVGNLFTDFSRKPIASASISQVHKARLRDGRAVAVKVQRPNVKKIMETDIEIMFYIAKLLEKHSKKIAPFRPVKIVDEFRSWTEKELDFRVEAKNAKRFYKNFKGSASVIIPKVFDKYSTQKVLTLEFIDGIELHNIIKVKGKKGYNIRQVMKNGFDSILTQVFIHGFFHADPHPSNILVLKGNKIALVDFGIVGYFDNYLKQKSISLLYGIVDEDLDAIVDTFLDMGLIDEGETDIESFKECIKAVIEPLQKSELRDIKVSYVLEEILDIALRHNVKMPLDFVLFGKAIVEIEGIALEYEPDFKLIENIKPFIEKLIKNEAKPVNMVRDFMKNIAGYGRLFREFPVKFSSALEKIQRGTVKVDVEDTDIKRLASDIDRSSNRLTYGMMIVAFLVTGALLVNIGRPVLYGFPLASLLCFVIAVIFLITLFISIRKEGKEEKR